MLKPNYRNNIINISATFADYLQIDSNFKKIRVLKRELMKKYKNVVFFIFDGFGYYNMKKLLSKDNILVKNCKKKVTTVFPCTTTNATTTYMSMSYPSTHKWLGWSTYFPEIDRIIDLYPARDTYTDEKIDKKYIEETKPFSPYYLRNNSDIKVYTFFPPYVTNGPSDNSIYYQNSEEMFNKLNIVCENNDKKFIYCYHDSPDNIMHVHGVESEECKNCVNKLVKGIEDLTKNNPDTLIVISADHGHIDVEEIVDLYKDEEIMKMLDKKPSLGLRALSFKVKKEYYNEFQKVFNKKYSKDFKLYKTDKLISKGVFGDKDLNLKEYIGDFIASGKKSNKVLKFKEDAYCEKGFHDGLTKNELYVPLIIIGNK